MADDATIERIRHLLAPLQSGKAGEIRADQAQPVMAAAVASAGVTRMARALVLDLQLERMQRRQQVPDALGRGVISHSSAIS